MNKCLTGEIKEKFDDFSKEIYDDYLELCMLLDAKIRFINNKVLSYKDFESLDSQLAKDYSELNAEISFLEYLKNKVLDIGYYYNEIKLLLAKESEIQKDE